jgi:hypothetical protein
MLQIASFKIIDRVTLLATKYPLLTWRSKLTEMGSNGQKQRSSGVFGGETDVRKHTAAFRTAGK